jgi:hypothetical protein
MIVVHNKAGYWAAQADNLVKPLMIWTRCETYNFKSSHVGPQATPPGLAQDVAAQQLPNTTIISVPVLALLGSTVGGLTEIRLPPPIATGLGKLWHRRAGRRPCSLGVTLNERAWV